MRDRLPCAHLILQRRDEILLRQSLMLARVDLLDQVLLRYHFAGQFLPICIVDGEEGLGETALAQLLVLDHVFAIDDLECLQPRCPSALLFPLFISNHFPQVDII